MAVVPDVCHTGQGGYFPCAVVVLAPEDQCATQLAQLVNQAQQSIHFIAFSFTHDDIGQAVTNRAKAGVAVRGVFENRGSNTEYSELGRMA